MKTISVDLLNDNLFTAIGKEWMLVTAGTQEKFNMMTASWGSAGELWGKPVAMIFVRPERYTFQFLEEQERFTLTFLGPDNRQIYNLCGSKSGREINKVQQTGLRPIAIGHDAITYEQARLTLVCRKLYADDIKADHFISQQELKQWYNNRPGGSLHRLYIAEIEQVLTT